MLIRKVQQPTSVDPLYYFDEGLDRAVAVSSRRTPMPIGIGDSASIDPFGRLRISEPYTLFDSKQLYDKAPLFFDETLAGGATSAYVAAGACVRMAVANNGDEVIRQTYQRFNYQPGKGQLAFLTFNLNGGQANTAKQVGIFDANNGIFLELNALNLYVNIRNSTVDEQRVIQREWNLDTFDGSGDRETNPSGILLDIEKTQIFVIDFEWLGVGRVRVGFVINGVIYYCHEFLNANNLASVYMRTPNLPIRYRIVSGADDTEATMDHICSTIISEGGVNPRGKIFGANTGALVALPSQNVVYGMLAIRLRDTHFDLVTFIEDYSSLSTSNGNYYVSLWLNPTLSSGAWVFADFNTTYSGVQIADANAGVVISGGIRLDTHIVSGGLSENFSADNRRHLGASIAGVADIIAVSIQPLTNNQNCAVTLNWREI